MYINAQQETLRIFYDKTIGRLNEDMEKKIDNNMNLEIDSFEVEGIKPNACVFLSEACFNIPGGSYLLIDTDTPYIDGKLSVVLLDGEFRLLRVNVVNEVTLFTADGYSSFMEQDERLERVKYVGVALQVLINL